MQNQFSLKEARKAKESLVQRYPQPAVQPQAAKPQTPQVQAQQVQQIQPEIQQPQTQAVCPGPISPITPCPSPQFIDVLRVTKVFQECRIVETNQVVDVPVVPVGAADVQCLGSQVIGTPTCVINADRTVTVTFSFATAYQFLTATGIPIGTVQVVETVNETRTVRLSRAGEAGLTCEVEVFLTCIECFVSARGPLGEILEVTCCVGKQIVVKLVSLVQLLVPTFGYAPVPPMCEQVAGICPTFTPTWPPYPPQSPDFPFPRTTQGTNTGNTTGNTNGNGCGCGCY